MDSSPRTQAILIGAFGRDIGRLIGAYFRPSAYDTTGPIVLYYGNELYRAAASGCFEHVERELTQDMADGLMCGACRYGYTALAVHIGQLYEWDKYDDIWAWGLYGAAEGCQRETAAVMLSHNPRDRKSAIVVANHRGHYHIARLITCWEQYQS